MAVPPVSRAGTGCAATPGAAGRTQAANLSQPPALGYARSRSPGRKVVGPTPQFIDAWRGSSVRYARPQGKTRRIGMSWMVESTCSERASPRPRDAIRRLCLATSVRRRATAAWRARRPRPSAADGRYRRRVASPVQGWRRIRPAMKHPSIRSDREQSLDVCRGKGAAEADVVPCFRQLLLFRGPRRARREAAERVVPRPPDPFPSPSHPRQFGLGKRVDRFVDIVANRHHRTRQEGPTKPSPPIMRRSLPVVATPDVLGHERSRTSGTSGSR